MQAYNQLLPLLLLFAVMYFMMIRPQQKQARERKIMLDGLKKGDRVITIGGIHGVIDELDESTLVLTVAEGVKVKFNRAAVGAVQK